MPRTCLNKANNFCYICGEVTFSSQKRSITAVVRKAYYLYFGCKVGDQDKTWAPHICCNTCATNLRQWLNKKRKCMPFAVPMVWRNPTDHISDCYFCMTPPVSKGLSRKKKHGIQYPNIPSAIRPVPHGEILPVPKAPEKYTLDSDEQEIESSASSGEFPMSSQESYVASCISHEPHFISQNELNDLVRDFELPKTKSELLGSRLQQWNLLADGVRISKYRDRQQQLEPFYFLDGNFVVCPKVHELMAALKITYDSSEWRLFIDSSKTSLKAVLLHNGNTMPSIPVGYAVHVEETYDNIKVLLKCINYNQHQWQLCGDLKVVALVMGLQLGYTKYCCFLCEWNSREKDSHCIKKDWPLRQSLTPGEKNVKHPPLVESSKILLPPLHIKLGLMKNFVKAMDKTGSGFMYLSRKFPRMTEAKIKEGVFIGPQIRQLLQDSEFDQALFGKEKLAWQAFKLVAKSSWGIQKLTTIWN